ncbi:hypothetical protein [Undibacterium sp.]|uniref:hypothetical protein n=1 Tax=Undibacterium sp. TaxID=1914977 RepID=UPI00374DCFF9
MKKIFLSFVLASLTMTAAAPLVFAADAASADSLPSVDVLIKTLADKQKSLTALRHKYTYMEHEILRERDSSGKVTREDKTDYEIRFVKDHTIIRMMKKNGEALNTDEQASEDTRVQKQLDDAGRTPVPASTVENVLTATKITDVKRITYKNVKALSLEFEPRDGFSSKDKAEQLFSHLSGKMIVDEESGDMMHIDAKVTTALKVLGGVAGELDVGSLLVIDTTLVNDEVRIAANEKRRILARKLLAKSDTEYELSYSGYRKVGN